MANTKGKGTVFDLIVSFKDSQATDSVVFATAQIDQSHITQKSVREGKSRPDTNPYLVSTSKEADGKSFVDHTFAYSAKQIEAMKNAGQFESKDGMNAITLKASVMPTKDNKGLMINTNKPMGPSDNKWTPIWALDKQAKLTAVVRKTVRQERENAANAPEAQNEAQVQTEAQAPDFS